MISGQPLAIYHHFSKKPGVTSPCIQIPRVAPQDETLATSRRAAFPPPPAEARKEVLRKAYDGVVGRRRLWALRATPIPRP